MSYFKNITSFAELKKQYRALAIANHPDKGGDTRVMQEINAEFDKLYQIWEHHQPTTTTHTGYENDYNGATSEQYTEYVYNEYKWVGSRYKGQGNSEILDLIRQWLKDTYPHYKFSVCKKHYWSFIIQLLQADFEPFVAEHSQLAYYRVYYRSIEKDEHLTDRAKEVMANVRDYIMSYNYDDSDVMSDYHNTNFYLDLDIGSYKSPFQCVIPQLTCDKSKLPPEFKHPEGKTHKAIRLALNGAVFREYQFRSETVTVLGEITYRSDGEESFYPFSYGGYKTALKRVAKLAAAGIKCQILGNKYYSIALDSYTPETEAALEKERNEYEEAKKAWEENPNPQMTTQKKEKCPNVTGKPIENLSALGLQIVDYSERSFAVIGDTKPIKDELEDLGGSYNAHLKCGPGWIFSKSRIEKVKQFLSNKL